MWALKSSFFIWLSDKRLSLIKGIIDGWRSQDWQQQQTQRLSSSSDRELVRRWSPLRTLRQMGNGRLQNQTGEGLIENADTTPQKKQNLKVQWSLNQQIRLEWNRDNNAALSCTAHTLVLTSRAQIRFHFTIFFFLNHLSSLPVANPRRLYSKRRAQVLQVQVWSLKQLDHAPLTPIKHLDPDICSPLDIFSFSDNHL